MVGVLEVVGAGVDKTFLIADDVGVGDGSEDAHFVECVLLLSLVEVVELHLFDGVGFVIDEPLGLVDA